MRAVACRGPGALALEDVARPEPGPGEVVVAVRNCGICGSDLHWYHDQMMIPAVCPGHEIAGEIADVGPGVTTLRAGDRVAVEGIATCGACRYCVSGDYQRCPNIGIVGMTIPGGFADYLRMPARHCFRVPDGVEFATAALGEPLGVAVHGVRLSGLEIGQRVVVLGAGTIGLMAIVAARAGGAGEIVVTARRPQQKAAALALGADRVVDEKDPDGFGDTLDTAVAACRPGGTICVLGAYTKSPPFPALFVLVKELRILGSLVYGRAGARADFDIALDLLHRHGPRIAQTLITHRFPLDRIDDAFRAAADKTTGSIKVTIAP